MIILCGGKMINVALVVSKFNPEITSVMEKEAISEAKKQQSNIAAIVGVPGCFEIPLAISRLLKNKKIDAVVALGAIIKGGSGHDELIANAIASKLLDESIDSGRPIGLGILGPKISWGQAKIRAKDYAKRATSAAIEMAKKRA
jgi:6,7-dimethyl-8-ribityllumazine synthase